VVLVETVGVGQSEVMVADMTDLFLLLLAPAGGDELQGVKRGIMEIADLILINKADGELKSQAIRTCADYTGALRLLRKRVQDPKDFPKAMTISALEEDGLETVWVEVETLSTWRRDKGYLDANRRRQAKVWFEDEVRRGVLGQLERDETLRSLQENLHRQVAEGALSPDAAAAKVLRSLITR
jgi:LAO/AO transport system kinase